MPENTSPSRLGSQPDKHAIIYRGKRFRFWKGGRALPDTAKGGNIVEDALGRWHVCFHVEIADELKHGRGKIGIDLGLKTMIACSNGTSIRAPQFYRRREEQLAVAQRAGNKRRAKAINAKIRECRKDFIHKATTKIARNNALIAVGKIRLSDLTGRGFVKSALDAGWSMFRSQLRYKASRHGATYLEIDESFTTQMCSACGSIPASSPKGMGALGIRAWDCSACGKRHDRDVNAARNILTLALSVERRGDESERSPPHGCELSIGTILALSGGKRARAA